MNVEIITRILRMAVLIIIMTVLAFFCVVRLLQIQVVDPGKWLDQTVETFTAEQSIEAVRGRILDSQGRELNTNKIVYKVILQRAFLPFGDENEIIAGTLNVLIKHDYEWLDSAPITLEAPYQFKNVPTEELDKFKSKLGLNYDATVENCVQALAVNYKIDTDKYDSQMIRYIGGVRYEMELREFSFQNRYVLAEDISMDILIELKEKAIALKGVDVVEEPIRLYLDGEKLPHIRGMINSINEEQYAALKESGYRLNDVIGFFGIEESMESTLRGENGIRRIVRDTSWEIISDEVPQEAHAGNSVRLTIDTEFQKTVENILKDHINWVNQPKHWGDTSRSFAETPAGAIVVLDVKTGAILAMANYPSYDLNDHIDMMLADAAGDPHFPNKPLLDRCAANGYRPGSSFKTVTATAGLLNGTIDRNSRPVNCTRRYYYSADYSPACTTYQGYCNVVTALCWSSNCYFYEVGKRLGIERLAETAERYGVGNSLNCDIYSFPGRMTTAESYESLNSRPISGGDVIQAAIGQSETLLTPLHMATIAMTIANNGVRYRPYLVDSVWNYDYTELVSKTEVEIVEDMSEGNEDHFTAIQEGMNALAKRQTTGIFQYLPEFPAYKTGTPELDNNRFNSTVLGYYPFEEPQIAFAVVLEEGEFSSRAIRSIIDAYFYDCYEPDLDEDGNVKTFWKRWDGPKTAVR